MLCASSGTPHVFTANSGSTFWTRPVDTATLPIKIRIVGGNGSATLRKYGSGEPDIPPGQTPGTPVGSLTNPDVFLHDSSYQEPIYETRLECNPGFAWRNAACILPPITDAVHQRVAAAPASSSRSTTTTSAAARAPWSAPTCS